MPENSLHARAWPWLVGAALVYGGTVIGAWWPRTGPPEVNLIPLQPHVQALRRGARTPGAQGAWRDLADLIARMGQDPASMAAAYSVALRITPARVRGF